MRCRCALCSRGAVPPLRGAVMAAAEDRVRAAQEALFCEQVLLKGGDNVLHATLRMRRSLPGRIIRRATSTIRPRAGSGTIIATCRPPRPSTGTFIASSAPPAGTGRCTIWWASASTAHGRLQRLFTVNQWVVGDTWLDAEPSIALLERFDMQMPLPSYLTNRWLTAVLRLYADEIAALIRQRDATLADHQPPEGTAARDDRALEVTSELRVDLAATAKDLGL